LTYAWDFGDGTHAVGENVSHTYSHPQFADVKLVVRDANGATGTYRQAVNVGASKDPPPSTSSCGLLSTAERNAVLRENGLPVTAVGNPLGLPSARSCKDVRKFSFRIHQPRHGRVVRLTAFINGRRIARRHAHRITGLTIKRLPIGLFQLKIVASTSDHKHVVSVRTYRGCKKSRPHTRVHRHKRR
jgi:hypothetical protein